MEPALCAVVLMVCVLAHSKPICDQTEFLHPNGTCVACSVCKPGEQLSGDCGFGDGGEHVCIPCDDGTFSSDTDVAPCRRCTQCSLLNRHLKTACSPTRDGLCGQCLPGYYEVRSMTGEAELLCLPCFSRDAVHEDCLLFAAQDSKSQIATVLPEGNMRESKDKRAKEETFSVVLAGAATVLLIIILALLFWILLLSAERFKPVPEPEELRGEAKPHYKPLQTSSEKGATQTDAPVSAEDPARGLSSVNHESELYPTSIVINVTTNIKPCSENKDNVSQEQQQGFTTEEMEQKLQTIWELAQGQSIEMLDYDSVQDISLLLDSVDSIYILKRLALSLGIPPHVAALFRGFQDLFQYLRTSTYTQLPQLAQAAALLPNFEIVSRIHKAVVIQRPLTP
ncbi:uncharacterized protein LOC144994859 [Oryzias latipes]